jgi:hypothetical protein
MVKITKTKGFIGGIAGLILGLTLSTGCAQKHEECEFYERTIDGEKIEFKIDKSDFSYTNTIFFEPENYTSNDSGSTQTKIAKKYIDDKGNDLKIDQVCDQTSTINWGDQYFTSDWSCHKEPELLEVAQVKFDDYLEKIKDYKEKERLKELEANKRIYAGQD